MPLLDLEEIWTVAEAAEHARVSPATIRSWAHRERQTPGSGLPVARNHDGQEIRDERGRPRFWPVDVAIAEARTRARARRPEPETA